jgi:probable F420-dependent oxidoreductase
MMAAAAVTSKLRVGALVFANDYKHPAVLAKELATIDFLSEGRVEVGLGAGWMTADYQMLGIPMERPGVRIERLREGIRIIKQSFGPDPVEFDGRYYQVHGLVGHPRPVQSPPPLLIGGGGPKMLELACEEADIISINGNLATGEAGAPVFDSMRADAVSDRVSLVRQRLGARGDQVTLHVNCYWVGVGSHWKAAAEGVGGFIGYDAAALDATPYALYGEVNQVVEKLHRLHEQWGFTYFSIPSGSLQEFAPVIAALS